MFLSELSKNETAEMKRLKFMDVVFQPTQHPTNTVI
jgi:hypothetical protein